MYKEGRKLIKAFKTYFCLFLKTFNFAALLVQGGATLLMQTVLMKYTSISNIYISSDVFIGLRSMSREVLGCYSP